MTTKRVVHLALGLTIAAFMSGCGDSTNNTDNKDGSRSDAADAKDAVPDTKLPGDYPITDGPPVADANRLDGGGVDQGPGSFDTQVDVLDAPAADGPADVSVVDSPADRARTEAGGEAGPACTDGTSESCASPSNPLIGACHAGTRTCAGGVWGACSEALPATRESCNGIDDDCNGVIDEGCAAGCVVVCSNCSGSSDGGAANGSVEHPFATIEAAIAAAGAYDAGTRNRICVVGGATCRDSALYRITGPLKVPDGLIIQGAYAITETGLTYCGVPGLRPRTTLSFAANEGVIFDQTVVTGAELSGMFIEVNPSSGSAPVADTVTAIAIKGGQNVTLSRVYVGEGFAAKNTQGVAVTSGGQATITGSSISTGQGSVSAIGLYVNGSKVDMRNNCDRLVNGKCASSCFDGGSMQGIHGYTPSNPADAPLQSSGAYLVSGASSLVGNMLCGGATRIGDGQALSTVATLRCENDGCSTVSSNVIVGSTDRDTLAVALINASPRVDGNAINGGCGSHTVTGARIERSGARLQNNQIEAAQCSSGDGSSLRGLHLIASESAASAEIHSNTIEPSATSVTCQSIGVLVELANGIPSGMYGVLRNNIVSAGVCSSRVAISEVAGVSLVSLQNNDLYGPQADGASAKPILYRHGSTNATTAAQVNAISLASGNISADPGYAAYPNDLHLKAGSPCIDQGTNIGAPASDGDSNPRPVGDGYDIGAYELSM